MVSCILISTVIIVQLCGCAAGSGGLITRNAVVGKWTLWAVIQSVRRTQIKCAASACPDRETSKSGFMHQFPVGRAALVCYFTLMSALSLWYVNHHISHRNISYSHNLVCFGGGCCLLSYDPKSSTINPLLFLIKFFCDARLLSWSEIITLIKELWSKEIRFLKFSPDELWMSILLSLPLHHCSLYAPIMPLYSF